MARPGKSPRPSATSSAYSWLTPIAVAIACAVGYFQVMSVGFLADDFTILHALEYAKISDIGSGGVYFRPFAFASFALDRLVFGDCALCFHTVNVALHFVASLGVAALTRMLIKQPFAGLTAGLIFALHPAHVEAVSWIAGRYDVLCAALLIWSFVCYIRHYEDCYSKSNRSRGRILLPLSITLLALASLTKEQAFVFPLTILLYEMFLPNNSDDPVLPLSKRWTRVLPYFVAVAVIFCIRWIVLGGPGGYIPEESSGNIFAAFPFN